LAVTDGSDRYRMKISIGVTRYLALSVAALFSVTAAFAADTISGKVVGVADGGGEAGQRPFGFGRSWQSEWPVAWGHVPYQTIC